MFLANGLVLLLVQIATALILCAANTLSQIFRGLAVYLRGIASCRASLLRAATNLSSQMEL